MFPALDGVGHNVAEFIQVLPAKRFFQTKRTVHTVEFHHGSPEVMRHAHDTFCTDNIRICIMSLIFGELSVNESLCDVEHDAVLESAVALHPPGVLVIPHPHALRMPGFIFTAGIPAGDVYVVHAAIVVGGTFILVSLARRKPRSHVTDA